MDMLDWNNPSDIQAERRKLAKEVKSINVFLQPANLGQTKNVWDNCAIVLSERSDDEIQPYLFELFHWLEDMNWPGSECVFKRLKRYRRDVYYEFVLKECVNETKNR